MGWCVQPQSQDQLCQVLQQPAMCMPCSLEIWSMYMQESLYLRSLIDQGYGENAHAPQRDKQTTQHATQPPISFAGHAHICQKLSTTMNLENKTNTRMIHSRWILPDWLMFGTVVSHHSCWVTRLWWGRIHPTYTCTSLSLSKWELRMLHTELVCRYLNWVPVRHHAVLAMFTTI